jgi:hypothetical protein
MFEQEQINERIVRIIGAASIPDDLSEKDITLTIKGSVLKVEEEDNQDGTKNRVYKIKMITAEIQ